MDIVVKVSTFFTLAKKGMDIENRIRIKKKGQIDYFSNLIIFVRRRPFC